jgi:hypothetical protein
MDTNEQSNAWTDSSRRRFQCWSTEAEQYHCLSSSVCRWHEVRTDRPRDLLLHCFSSYRRDFRREKVDPSTQTVIPNPVVWFSMPVNIEVTTFTNAPISRIIDTRLHRDKQKHRLLTPTRHRCHRRTSGMACSSKWPFQDVTVQH